MRVLLLITGVGGDQISGPDIRGWEMAAVLGRRHEVTAVARRAPSDVREGIRVVPWRRRRILLEALRHDWVIAPWVPPYLLAALARRRTVTVADLYDPLELEVGTLRSAPHVKRRLERERLSRRLQLVFADMLLCAGEGQREHLQRELEEAVPDPARRPPILNVPFGVGRDPPPAARRPLRARFPEIGERDPVLLWWGSVWRWFDPHTAILAFERVLSHLPNARLVFTAGAPATTELRELSEAERLRELASSRGLLDRSVFLLDQWIPYAERHEYLQEADVGISLHRDPAEAARAARARYMDYLWARLPCVLSEGNEVADRFAQNGFALTVPVGDPGAAGAALLRLLDERARSRARAAAETLVAALGWPRVLAPLLEAMEAPGQTTRRPGSRAAAAATHYYAVRLSDFARGLATRATRSPS